MNSRSKILLAAAATAVLMLPAVPSSAAADHGRGGNGGAVYAMTNDPVENRVAVFYRAQNGTLTAGPSFATGGIGSGQFEDSSNGLIIATRNSDSSPTNFSSGNRFVIATNAASDNISVFRTYDDGQRLEPVDLEPSNGAHPVSVTVRDGVLYVLNNGDAQFAPPPNCDAGPGVPNITGFTLSEGGDLVPLPNSTRLLSSASLSGCAQVSFTPDGKFVVVTERDSLVTGVIDTFPVNGDGTLGTRVENRPAFDGPFGFNFTQNGFLLTTEQVNGLASPGQGGAASYTINDDGTLTANGPRVGDGGTDTCWLVLSGDDKYAYVTNFFSGSISSYRVTKNGRLRLLDPLADATIGIGAADEATDQAGRYLYVRNAIEGTVVSFRIESNGGLTKIDTDGGLPIFGVGLAAY